MKGQVMFLEVIIVAVMGLAAIVTALLIGGPDAHDLKTVGVGMVGAAIGVWTAGRGGRNSNGKNGNGHEPTAEQIVQARKERGEKDPTA